MPKETEDLLNGKQLAAALKLGKRGGSTISLMKRAGYKFSHSYKTTLSHAREWLRTSGFTPSAARKLSPRQANKSLARKRVLAGSAGGPSSSCVQPSSSQSAPESQPAQTC